MQIEVVGARFRHGLNTYYFSPNSIECNVGEYVIAQTEKGDEMVRIVEQQKFIDASELDDAIKNILRKATAAEVENAAKFEKEAMSHIDEVKKMAKASGLEMKIISIEASYDFSRMVINFTSEGRVDFRSFAKKLAERFKKRIELRQIGPRDAVRHMGGIGMCGKECCCSQGFGQSDHISIKMAKNQNLSLNPTAISGVCGKLLCCLAYENEQYAASLKVMPKVGSLVTTNQGKGKVIYNDLLNRVVTVKFESENSSEIKDFELKDVKFEGK